MMQYVSAAPGAVDAEGRLIVAWGIDSEGRAIPVYAPKSLQQAEPNYLALEIMRTDKGFKKNSYWRFKSGNFDFLFEVSAGDAVPNDERVDRVQAATFKALSKQLPVVPVEKLFDSAFVVPGEEPDDMDMI